MCATPAKSTQSRSLTERGAAHGSRAGVPKGSPRRREPIAAKGGTFLLCGPIRDRPRKAPAAEPPRPRRASLRPGGRPDLRAPPRMPPRCGRRAARAHRRRRADRRAWASGSLRSDYAARTPETFRYRNKTTTARHLRVRQQPVRPWTRRKSSTTSRADLTGTLPAKRRRPYDPFETTWSGDEAKCVRIYWEWLTVPALALNA
jgi:hypothetical protein